MIRSRTLGKQSRKLAAAALIVTLIMTLLLSGCGVPDSASATDTETTIIEDDYGRKVEIPKEVTKIAASGATAQMILMTIAPEMLVGLTSSPSTLQMPYFPEDMWYLPTFGQFYGSKSSLNVEALIDAQPQVIIDLGDRKVSGKSDMNDIQKRTEIPTFFYEGSLDKLPETYRKLGQILGKEEQAEKLAVFIEETNQMAAENKAKIPPEKVYTVLYGTGPTGLACNAYGSSQADVIDIIGAENAIHPAEITSRGGGTTVSLEEIYKEQPDVIILSTGGPYEEMTKNEWSGLDAVKNGRYYEIPDLPYSWMSSPPSVNRVLGVYWLGKLLYPEYYDFDMIEKAQEFYSLFWHYDLSEEEAREMLAHSVLKDL